VRRASSLLQRPACARAQVNLKLFTPAPNKRRTVLLFVFRDRTRTPLPRLVETWEADLGQMWAGITKPQQYEGSSFTDFFEVRPAPRACRHTAAPDARRAHLHITRCMPGEQCICRGRLRRGCKHRCIKFTYKVCLHVRQITCGAPAGELRCACQSAESRGGAPRVPAGCAGAAR
jgi:hypothetical protein